MFLLDSNLFGPRDEVSGVVGRIDYLALYSTFGVLPLLLALVGAFVSLGLAAADFLCPNLYTLSKFLGLSDNLAGLTLLALGNGSADILSTYKAFSLGEGSLAAAELVGAAFFVTTVVVGSISIVHPFKVPKELFTRDIAFYTLATLLVCVFLADSYLTVWNCVALVTVYVAYVVVVVSSHRAAKRRAQSNLREMRARGVAGPEEDENVFLDEFSGLPTIDELDELTDFDLVRKTSDAPVDTGSYGLKVLLRELGEHASSRGHFHLDDRHNRSLTAPRPSTRPLYLRLGSLLGPDAFYQVPSDELADRLIEHAQSDTGGHLLVPGMQRAYLEPYKGSSKATLEPFGGIQVPIGPTDVDFESSDHITSSKAYSDPSDVLLDNSHSVQNAVTSTADYFAPERPRASITPIDPSAYTQNYASFALGTVPESNETGTPSSIPNASETAPETHSELEDLEVPAFHVSETLEPADLTTATILELFLPDSTEYSELSIANKVYFVLSYPIAVLLNITTPVRDQHLVAAFDERFRYRRSLGLDGENSPVEDDNSLDFALDKVTVQVQLFLAPILFGLLAFEGSLFWLKALPVCLVISVLLAVFVGRIYRLPVVANDRFWLTGLNYFSAFVGFVVSISWISVFATEIISILTCVAVIYNLSDDILGITVFALGNSIGDLMSNVTISLMGMPLMAFGACFGGPLLSLSSMGMSGLILVYNNNPYVTNSGFRVENSSTLMITVVSLFLNVIFIFLVVPYRGWHMDKKLGYILIANWCVSTMVCLLVEFW